MAVVFRLAVVSPFLDKQHGTERCVAEQVERLARNYGYEIHLYSQQVDGVPCDERRLRVDRGERSDRGSLIWHRVPNLPGPHLFRYLWWFIANHLQRWWDRRARGLRAELVYSPGINCLDADVVSVHIVFAEFYSRTRTGLALRNNPPRVWPRLLHRHLYYRLIMALERAVYARKGLPLVAVSRKTSKDLARFYGRHDKTPVIYHALDPDRFNPERRTRLAPEARQALGLAATDIALLILGNDWRKKGLGCLLQAVNRVRNPSLRVLVVGRDDRAPYEGFIEQHGMSKQVQFLPPRPDVEFYYAASDIYVGPSLEDAFALPPAEAMACGLPVIVSSQAGVSEIITDGVDGLILKDPADVEQLAQLIRRLYDDPPLRRRLGESAVQTARRYTWDRNVAEMHAVFQAAMKSKQKRMAVS